MTQGRIVAIVLSLLTATSTAAAPPTAAQTALPMGELAPGQVADDGATIYAFAAATAGLLTVMVRGVGGTDLILEVGSAFGTTFENGRSDSDLFGDAGNERVSVMIRRPGDYQVRVSSYSGQGSFEIGGTWLAVPGLELPPDPDGAPATAQVLAVGSSIAETLDTDAGDGADWYVYEATADVAVTVLTEGEDDIYLEAYADGAFSEYLDRSDQDMQGTRGNESITVRLRAGDKIYFKVAPFGGAASYAIRVGVM